MRKGRGHLTLQTVREAIFISQKPALDYAAAIAVLKLQKKKIVGFRWSLSMKWGYNTDYCTHATVPVVYRR